MKKNKKALFLIFLILIQSGLPAFLSAQESADSKASMATENNTQLSESKAPEETSDAVDILESAVFDDEALIEGYTKKYTELSVEIILEMIKDETLSPYQMTAAIKVLSDQYLSGIVSREKVNVERILLRRLGRTDSPYVQVESMSALCYLDRYRYFDAMVPALIQKLNHYNVTVRESAFSNINKIIQKGNNRPREARIVFNTLRKILFLERRRLATIKEPGPKLVKKLQLLRWSVKILGSQELQKLPKEVISLL